MRDAELVELVIEGLQRRRPGVEGFTLIHPATKGAAMLAADVARRLDWAQIRAYPAARGEQERSDAHMVATEHTTDEPIDLAVGFLDVPLTASRPVHQLFKRLRTAEVAIWMIWAPTYRAADTFQEPPWVRSRATGQAPAWSREIQPGVVPTEP